MLANEQVVDGKGWRSGIGISDGKSSGAFAFAGAIYGKEGLLWSVITRCFALYCAFYVELAILMPVVAAMGGNAGIQASTIAVSACVPRHHLQMLINKSYSEK